MSESFRVSGKKLPFPAAPTGWKLTSRPGGWVIAEDPSGNRVRMFLSELRGRLSAKIAGHGWFGEIVEDRRVASGGTSAGADADLVAQFPGKVRKILVETGAKVGEGDPLILVEAMKMEFAVKAPYAGKVTKVLVREGQQLSPGERFLELAEMAGGALGK